MCYNRLMKILSPAGNLESLKMAVYNGADEVYLGINSFNARNNIEGFDFEDLKEAVDFAHIYNVKVCLAINILFSDKEIQSALDTIVDSYNLGVDAFIIQDLGLASLVHKYYPQIEIHASTQMGIHNLEGVKALLKYGFKRVVLARETPIEEIKRIKQNCDIEIEFFAQGALCVSFSGNCYLSSYLLDASGNRGKCKQLCRLPYSFEKNGKTIKTGYLLSAKDFNLIDRLDDLKNAGVDVIKIEGRARRASYVALATREYRNAIDKNKINKDNLKLAFNRNFTPGYLDGNGNIISNIQNHIGINVGKIEKINKGKKFTELILSSNRKLYPKSTFKLFSYNKERSTLTAFDLQQISDNKYRLTTTQPAMVGDKVNLIIDANLEELVLSYTKKRSLGLSLTVEQNKKLSASYNLNNKTYKIDGDILLKAEKQPLLKEEFINNFNKNQFFDISLKFETFEEVFLPKQKLNEFRRAVLTQITETILSPYYHNEQKIKIKNTYSIKKFCDFQIVTNTSQPLESSNIIYSPEQYKLKDIQLMQKESLLKNKQLYLDTPNFATHEDIKILKHIIETTKVAIVANNYYALTFNTKAIIGAGLNVYNSYSAQELNKPILTAESNISTKIDFPYMTLRHCPMKEHLNATCAKCPYKDGYQYRMDNGTVLNLKRKKLSSCTFYLT